MSNLPTRSLDQKTPLFIPRLAALSRKLALDWQLEQTLGGNDIVMNSTSHTLRPFSGPTSSGIGLLALMLL